MDLILIDDHVLSLGAGITDLCLLRRDGVADIAGLLVTNLDPGGISLDDVRFGCVPVTG